MRIKNKEGARQNRHSFFGVPIEFITAVAVVILAVALLLSAKSCSLFQKTGSFTSGVYDDVKPPAEDSPATSVLNPLPISNVYYPINLTDGIDLNCIYSSNGYFPEDGTDTEMKNVLAVKLSNKSEKDLEYFTFTLKINGFVYKFSVATLPKGKSIYVYNSECKEAPKTVTSVESNVEYEIYFSDRISTKSDELLFKVQQGSIVVTNKSQEDIRSDIVVYYKSTASDGYLGGITYRFRIKGGLDSGKSYSSYAPHAYAHMTEIVFVEYEEK